MAPSVVVVFLTRLAVLAASWPMRVIADDESGVILRKTVTAATIMPILSLSLSLGGRPGGADQCRAERRYRLQTVADLSARKADGTCIDIIGGSGSGLQRAQRDAVTSLGAEEATGSAQRHAEVTVVANLAGWTPLVLGISAVGKKPNGTICDQGSPSPDTCRTGIPASGGTITPDQRGAVWWGNLP